MGGGAGRKVLCGSLQSVAALFVCMVGMASALNYFFTRNFRRSFFPERGAECRVSGGPLPSGAALLVCMLAGREGERP